MPNMSRYGFSTYGFSTIALILLLSTAGSGQQPSPAAAPAAPARQPEAAQSAPAPRTAAQLVNIRLDLTINEHRDSGELAPRTVTMLLADRENGRVRSSQGNAMLNVDARPEIVRDGKVRVSLALEYRWPSSDGDKGTTLLTQSMAVLLDDGKPLVVSQSVDPVSQRATVKVELRATIAK